ncbi:MAG: hypothetical protein IPN73_13935 [Saprospiraceae bacterium]|nr:hypothetical protein [Saprospiraceae bacterium]
MPTKHLFLLITICYLFACKQETTSPLPVAEKWRPTYHFTPDSMWMNDPNGLVYTDGIYHLFYQFYPDSNVWGPMHWGHATSTDLVSWEHQPIALYPDSLGYIFLGLRWWIRGIRRALVRMPWWPCLPTTMIRWRWRGAMCFNISLWPIARMG